MKTQDIKRGISPRNQRPDRGSADLGRVARLRDASVTVDEIHTKHRTRGMNRSRNRSVLVISIILGVGTMAVLGFAVSLWLKPMLQRRSADQASDAPLIVRVESQFQSPSREQAIGLVKRALSVQDHTTVQSLFRTGKSDPRDVLEYVRTVEQRDGVAEDFHWLSSMDRDGLLMEGVLVIFKGSQKPVERLAILTPDAGGSWKVDFEAFARIASSSWESLLEKKAKSAVVRLIVRSDVYYNGPFRDESRWDCYAMVSPDLEEVLQGYCQKDSPQAEAMRRLFADGATTSRAALEIATVEDADSRQFEIKRVVAPEWVVPDSASNGE